jgi:hypothetical protein
VSITRYVYAFCAYLYCSLTLQSPVSLNIYNQCQDINLISPVYFIHGGKWDVVPNREIDVNTMMTNRIEFDFGQDMLDGALAYRVQRQHAESDEFVRYGSKGIWLLVVWRGKYTEGLRVIVLLVEHDQEIDWDEDKLRWLHQKYWDLLNVWVKPIKANWALNDATVLTTTIRTRSNSYEQDIFISEGIKDNIDIPLWMDTER